MAARTRPITPSASIANHECPAIYSWKPDQHQRTIFSISGDTECYITGYTLVGPLSEERCRDSKFHPSKRLGANVPSTSAAPDKVKPGRMELPCSTVRFKGPTPVKSERFDTRPIQHERGCPETSYECPFCTKGYKRLAALENHLRIHTDWD